MKELEDRLREQFKRCAQAGFDTDVDEAQAAEDDGVAIVLDALAILVADAPRIEPAPADWSGNIHDSPDWVEDFIRHEGVWYFSSKRFAALSNFTQGAEQIHTNSPSEGKG